MLTGGRAAEKIYRKHPLESLLSAELRDVRVLLSDERCVPPSHQSSNFLMVKKNLFPHAMPKNFSFYRMHAEAEDLNYECDRYSALLAEPIDVILLSMGEDGHIASLFPDSSALFETERKVVPVNGPKFPFQRLTITPPVIKAAKQVYVLAIGDEKRRKYEEALLDPEDISSIPARLVLDRTWIFDLDEEIDLCSKL